MVLLCCVCCGLIGVDDTKDGIMIVGVVVMINVGQGRSVLG